MKTRREEKLNLFFLILCLDIGGHFSLGKILNRSMLSCLFDKRKKTLKRYNGKTTSVDAKR